MKKINGIIAILFVLILAGCDNKSDENISADNETIPVKIRSLQKEDIKKVINASGQFTTDDETYLSFKTGGVIGKLYVKEGDAVKKGQLLATLNLAEINAMVEQAKAGYEKSLRDYNRVLNLYKDSVATLEQMQNVKTALDVAGRQLNIAEFNQKYSEIRALDDGFILKKLVNEGQMASPGMPIVQTNGAGSGTWLLKIGVSDKDWATIKLNDYSEVEMEAYPGQKFTAHVFRKSEGIDPYTGTFSVDLKLSPRPAAKLASGLFGKAKIIPDQKLTAWRIPFEALLDGDGNAGYVFVTNDNSTAQKIKVSIADIENDDALISSGLENAHSLIVSGSAYLNENSKIKIVN